MGEGACATLLLASLLITQLAVAGQVDAKTLNVAVSINALAGIVESVGGDRVEVSVLLPEGVEPHAFQATTEVIHKALRADLIVCTGHFPFESNLLSVANKPSVGLSDYERHGLRLLKQAEGKVNLHGYWLSPENAVAIASAVAEKLSQMDPEGSAYYTQKLYEFQRRVRATFDDVVKAAEDSGLRGISVLATFPSEQYVLEPIGVNVANFIVKEEDVFISGGDLAKVYEQAARGEIKLIVVSENAKLMKAGEYAEQVSRDTGLPMVYVKTLAFEFGDYVALLSYNAGALASASCLIGQAKSMPKDYSHQYYVMAVVVLAFISSIEALVILRRRS